MQRMKRTPTPPRHPRLRRVGIVLLVLGAIVFFAPLPPVDSMDAAARVISAARWGLWMKFAGTVILFVGNVLRLLGEQGHPGLPWPLLRGVDHDALSRWIVRKRFAFHKRHPNATPLRRLAGVAR
jgi:hypothetical protein